MEITLDLGRVPSVLAALSNPATMRLAVNAAAEQYTTEILDWIAAGRSFTPRSPGGGLEQGITWRPLADGGAEVFVINQPVTLKGDYPNATPYQVNPQGYANYVEHGTRPHVIRPKPGRKGLSIQVSGGGGYIVRRMVNHPGTPPMPFFFADMETRKGKMVAQMISVLAAVSGGSHG